MEGLTQKFKEIADKAETVAVRSGKNPDLKKTLAVFALHQIFLKLGKKSGVDLSALDEKNKNCALRLFGEKMSADNFPQKENILIKLNAKETPISALKYETEGDILKIILESGKASTADLKTITVSKEKTPVDLLILVEPPEAELEGLASSAPHRDIARFSAGEQGLAVKLAEISEAFFKKIPDEFKEALWFLGKEESKTEPLPQKEIWALLARLLEAGIDFEKIKNAKEAVRPADFWKLFGRALARSEFEKELKTTWAFLPKADFEKTGQGERALLDLMEELRILRPESVFWAILWEKAPKQIGALLACGEKEKLNGLAGLMGALPASSYFFADGFSAFSEAELKIRGFIRKVL